MKDTTVLFSPWLCAALLSLVPLSLVPAMAYADDAGPTVEHSSCSSFAAGAPLVIRSQISDPDGVYFPRVLYRFKVGQPWAEEELRSTGEGKQYSATLEIPSDAVLLEYYLEAFDALGQGPSLVGSETAPISIPMGQVDARCAIDLLPAQVTKTTDKEGGILASDPAPEKKARCEKVHCRWWFWTIIGVAAAGIGVGTYYGVQAAQAPGVPDRVQLNIEVSNP